MADIQEQVSIRKSTVFERELLSDLSFHSPNDLNNF